MSFFVHIRFLIFYSVFVVFLLSGSVVFAADPPIMWLKFDDGSGTTPQDSGSNNIDGSFTATAPTWSAVVPDVAFSNPYSLSFTGSGDGVDVSWPSAFDFTETEARTFSFWYRPVANGEGQYSRLISWSSDRLEIAGTEAGPTTHKITYFDGNWHATNITLTLGTWYHVTFTYDGTTAKFYIGDQLQDEHALVGRALSGTLRIGNRVQQLDEGINGNIDDVRIYNYALSAAQVANLAAGSDDPDSPPDETAPTFSSVANSVSSTSATVTWNTNEAASTKVAYSVDSLYASSTSETDTSTRVTSHSKSLTNLRTCTIYNFKAISADAAGNYATSTASSFTTTGCSGGASPSSATSTVVTVSGAATSTLTDTGRSLTVATPANFTATSSSIVIQIKGLSAETVLGSIGKPSSSLSSAASIVFNVTALINNTTELDSFASPVIVSYAYTDADVSGLTESTLSMYHYNGTWSELDSCSVNTATNTITCEAPHFSVFALFGSASSNNNGSNSSMRGNGPLFTGDVATLPGYKKSRLQTIFPDGKVVYLDEKTSGLIIPTSLPRTNCSAYGFERTLRRGMVGEDVRALQRLMNCLGFTLATDGPGSPGKETTLFAERTFVAVKKFQEAYVIDILGPLLLKEGTGVFAERSQQKVDSLTK